MKTILYIAAGGALGAVLRYIVGLWLKPEYHAAFPVHTFLINATGCLALGMVFSYITLNGPHLGLQFFVAIGLLGGFTTFSSFSMETVYLFQCGEVLRGVMYVLVSNITGVGAAWFGYELIKWMNI